MAPAKRLSVNPWPGVGRLQVALLGLRGWLLLRWPLLTTLLWLLSRILALLARVDEVGRLIDNWERMGIWVLGEREPTFPSRLPGATIVTPRTANESATRSSSRATACSAPTPYPTAAIRATCVA